MMNRGAVCKWGTSIVSLFAVFATGIAACAPSNPDENDDHLRVGEVTTAATLASLPRTGWVAAASVGANPAYALDGNNATRWTTGTPQANGQWFEVDMRSTQTFSQLTLDAAGSTGDYPRGYAVYV